MDEAHPPRPLMNIPPAAPERWVRRAAKSMRRYTVPGPADHPVGPAGDGTPLSAARHPGILPRPLPNVTRA